MGGVIDHTPFATVVEPIPVDPENNVMVSPLTPVPVIVGLSLLVGVVIGLMTGAEGGVVSITRVCAADATETFPAGSVAFAVIV